MKQLNPKIHNKNETILIDKPAVSQLKRLMARCLQSVLEMDNQMEDTAL